MPVLLLQNTEDGSGYLYVSESKRLPRVGTLVDGFKVGLGDEFEFKVVRVIEEGLDEVVQILDAIDLGTYCHSCLVQNLADAMIQAVTSGKRKTRSIRS